MLVREYMSEKIPNPITSHHVMPRHVTSRHVTWRHIQNETYLKE